MNVHDPTTGRSAEIDMFDNEEIEEAMKRTSRDRFEDEGNGDARFDEE